MSKSKNKIVVDHLTLKEDVLASNAEQLKNEFLKIILHSNKKNIKFFLI